MASTSGVPGRKPQMAHGRSSLPSRSQRKRYTMMCAGSTTKCLAWESLQAPASADSALGVAPPLWKRWASQFPPGSSTRHMPRVLSVIGIPAAVVIADTLELPKHSSQDRYDHAQRSLLSLTQHARDRLNLARWMTSQNAPQHH